MMVCFVILKVCYSLNRYLLSVYLQHGVVYPNTLLGRLLAADLNPINCAVDKTNMGEKGGRQRENGLVDSLRHLLVSENYIKPWSAEHSLVVSLTRCF